MSPTQLKYNLRNREVICNVVLFGTLLVIAAISSLLWFDLNLTHSPQVISRLLLCGFAFLYIAITYLLLRQKYYFAAAYAIVLFYTLLATGIVWSWGINTPIGPLIFGLVVVLAGILLAARQALVAALTCSVILLSIQTVFTLGWYVPDLSWTDGRSNFSDVLAYCTVFWMLALVSWLYSQKMERLLADAKNAEAALLQQKATLKTQVKERTAELREVQLKEMEQMYRFTELGQLGVTLLHDLANHLTALTLEIDGLQNTQQSMALARARKIIQYLGSTVDSTRERLHGATQNRPFNVVQVAREAITFSRYKAAKTGVTIDWHPPTGSWEYIGDPTCLCQAIVIVTNNAIDAYANTGTSQSHDHRVVVALEKNDAHIIIRISDWGKGISQNKRKLLFKPFHGTKKSGLGVGLFIAQQTIESQFGGTITLNPPGDHTEFTIKLPLKNGR